ncbi:unnamed protein product, partial [Prorocentrum cordatum]
ILSRSSRRFNPPLGSPPQKAPRASTLLAARRRRPTAVLPLACAGPPFSRPRARRVHAAADPLGLAAERLSGPNVFVSIRSFRDSLARGATRPGEQREGLLHGRGQRGVQPRGPALWLVDAVRRLPSPGPAQRRGPSRPSSGARSSTSPSFPRDPLWPRLPHVAQCAWSLLRGRRRPWPHRQCRTGPRRPACPGRVLGSAVVPDGR